MKNKKSGKSIWLFALLILIAAAIWLLAGPEPSDDPPPVQRSAVSSQTDDVIPEYSGTPYCVLSGNIPDFSESMLSPEAFESYSALDELGRCGQAIACVCTELMPTEERGSISSVTPSGWVNVPYDFVDGSYLYNRCHLIGFQLSGENANERNLVTGTRYMNVEGMLPFENMIADYVKETDCVLYRVTPCFEGDELVCRGIVLEAYSIEDMGESICFNVYVYNVQPGVIIDYATGESRPDEEYLSSGEQHEYVLNTSSKKFHSPDCPGAQDISDKNRQDYAGSRELLIAQGYSPCSRCKP